MVVAHDVGVVGIAFRELDDNRVAIDAHVLDLLEKARHRGDRILAAVVVEAGDDVLGRDGLAVVELDALADLECPGLGIGRGVPLLGQFGRQLVHFVDGGEVVEEAAHAHARREAVLERRRINGIGGRTVAKADPQRTAALRFGRPCRAGSQQGRTGNRRGAGGHCTAEDGAPRCAFLVDCVIHVS